MAKRTPVQKSRQAAARKGGAARASGGSAARRSARAPSKPRASVLRRLRDTMDAFPGATSNVQWVDHLVYKINGAKMFAVLGRNEDGTCSMSFKADPREFSRLAKRAGMKPAPYLARAKWILIEVIERVPMRELVRLVREAHAQVLQRMPSSARLKI